MKLLRASIPTTIEIRPQLLTQASVLADPAGADLTRGTAYTEFKPDRVALQDATAQMAILQFMQTQLSTSEEPASQA